MVFTAMFLFFFSSFHLEIYLSQPPAHSPYTWNRLEYRPLEGFVVAVSPFNFTAIGGNLVGAPALMGREIRVHRGGQGRVMVAMVMVIEIIMNHDELYLLLNFQAMWSYGNPRLGPCIPIT
jgi:acyl-CoA reductase-like NAD-dependent aldehyde dehydrogenase